MSYFLKSSILNLKSNISKRRLILWAASFFILMYGNTKADESGFEIIAHRAKIQLFPATKTIACVDTLSIRKTGRKIEQLNFGFLPFYRVGNITVNGRKTEYTRDREFLRLNDVPVDTVIQVVVDFSGELSFQTEFTHFTSDRAVIREEEILPRGSKALRFVRFSLIVPKEWDAITVGRLVSHTTLNDSTIFVWESDQVLPLIGWICAGKFWNKEITNQKISFSVHLIDEDSSSATGVLLLMRDVVKFYSDKFIPYRFPKLSVVEVEDWVAGKNVLAIATPSMIMVKKLAFTTNDRFNRIESILPHEIAHQWWPATVFINDEDAAFLSEGMCEYSAVLYSKESDRMNLRDSLSRHPLLRSLLMRAQQGKDVPLQQKVDLRSLPTHYLKASYVHNMLRRIVGDSVFSKIYHEFAKRFETKRVSLSDFEKIAEELSDKKLDWFFEQWVKKRGIPRMKIYNVKSIQRGDRWATRGRVRVVGYEKYSALVAIGAQTSAGIKTADVWLGDDTSGNFRNDVPFEIITDKKPLRAILDPDGDVLKIQKLPVKLGDLREPAGGIMIIGTLRRKAHLLHLARSDSAEMDKAGWSFTIKSDTSVTLADLQNERVFLYGSATENCIVEDLQNIFPIGFRGDSVVVNGEVIYDSTFALLQVIESPYITQGLLCWIAPLSERARPELLPYDVSWTLVRGKDEITSGIWEVEDVDLVVEIK